jgi:hypothetical protein
VVPRWNAAVALLLVGALGACGSGSGSVGVGSTGTKLEIKGVATRGSVSPGSGNATELDISGTLECDGSRSTGTGAYKATASDRCRQLKGRSALFHDIATSSGNGVVCSQVYGGPQHASIKGSVDGVPVNVDIKRADGCGIDNWRRLEWLLGPPEL